MEAHGLSGASVRFDGRTVTVVRTSRLQGNRGERTILVGQIGSVVWHDPGRAGTGWIGFTAAGTVTQPARFGYAASTARKDPMTVVFSGRQRAPFDALRAAVEEARVTGPAGPVWPAAGR